VGGAQERYLLLVAGLVASGTNTAALVLYPQYIASRKPEEEGDASYDLVQAHIKQDVTY
jgi:hypothetical protein